MTMMSTFKGNPFCVFLLVLALLADSSDAFASHFQNRAQIGNDRVHCLTNERTPKTPTALFANKKDAGSDNTDTEAYAGVEDGSPLGVAIVLVGSLIVFGSGDDSALQNPESPSVWIVFVTASVAAGLARLFRYFRDRDG